MQPRDLLVEVQADVGGLAAADPELAGALLDHQDPLLVGAVAVDEERPPLALGLDLRLQLGRWWPGVLRRPPDIYPPIYFGGIRRAPSRRIVSPFSIGFSTT